MPPRRSERISGSNGRHLLSDSIRHVSAGKPLIRRLHGGINGEDILYGSSNDYVEKVYVYNKKKKVSLTFFTALHLLSAELEIFGYIQNFDTIQPTYFKVHVFVSLPPFSIVFIYLF